MGGQERERERESKRQVGIFLTLRPFAHGRPNQELPGDHPKNWRATNPRTGGRHPKNWWPLKTGAYLARSMRQGRRRDSVGCGLAPHA